MHHHPIVECLYCGKESIHESDRLHQSREEHQKELEYQTRRDEYKHKIKTMQE